MEYQIQLYGGICNFVSQPAVLVHVREVLRFICAPDLLLRHVLTDPVELALSFKGCLKHLPDTSHVTMSLCKPWNRTCYIGSGGVLEKVCQTQS